MGLKHLKLAVAKVELPEGVIALRGLSLNDIVPIVEAHKVSLAAFFSGAMGGNGVSLADTSSIAVGLLKAAPDAVARIIACAEVDGDADEESVEIAGKLPFPAQLEALEKIGQLTFAASSPKKVLEMVIRVAAGATEAMQDLRQP